MELLPTTPSRRDRAEGRACYVAATRARDVRCRPWDEVTRAAGSIRWAAIYLSPGGAAPSRPRLAPGVPVEGHVLTRADGDPAKPTTVRQAVRVWGSQMDWGSGPPRGSRRGTATRSDSSRVLPSHPRVSRSESPLGRSRPFSILIPPGSCPRSADPESRLRSRPDIRRVVDPHALVLGPHVACAATTIAKDGDQLPSIADGYIAPGRRPRVGDRAGGRRARGTHGHELARSPGPPVRRHPRRLSTCRARRAVSVRASACSSTPRSRPSPRGGPDGLRPRGRTRGCSSPTTGGDGRGGTAALTHPLSRASAAPRPAAAHASARSRGGRRRVDCRGSVTSCSRKTTADDPGLKTDREPSDLKEQHERQFTIHCQAFAAMRRRRVTGVLVRI